MAKYWNMGSYTQETADIINMWRHKHSSAHKHAYPPHFSPNAMRADFNLSRPKEANSCRKDQEDDRLKSVPVNRVQVRNIAGTFRRCHSYMRDTTMSPCVGTNSLPPRKRKQRGPDELQHVSKHCSPLSTRKTQKGQWRLVQS